MSELSARLRPSYLRARGAVRAFVVRHPTIDRTIGRSLVRVDLLLRRLGLASVLDETQTEITFDGCRFKFDAANREIASTILSTGEYEGATLDAIRSLVGRDGTFIDLGANLGFFSVLIGRAVSAPGHVHAFEPTPATATLLRDNIVANGVEDRVTLVQQAVSDQQGTARFSLYASAQANQLAVAGTDGASGSIEVTVTTLDAYLASLGWPRVDVVKMDVEGVETKVLDGMRELIRRQPALRIIFEYHLGQLDRARVSGVSLIDKVRELGFDRFEMLFRTREPIDLPREQERLERQAKRANLNILAWRE
jgi:FkbM family methyltransferase